MSIHLHFIISFRFNFINLFLNQSGQGSMIFLINTVFINESLSYFVRLWINLSLNLFFTSSDVYWYLESLFFFFINWNWIHTRITTHSFSTLVKRTFQRLFSSEALIWRTHCLTFLKSWGWHRLIRLERIFITIFHQFFFIMSQISFIIFIESLFFIIELFPFIFIIGIWSLWQSNNDRSITNLWMERVISLLGFIFHLFLELNFIGLLLLSNKSIFNCHSCKVRVFIH